jgi:hypothetical protein
VLGRATEPVPVGVNGERERRTGTSYHFSILYADPRLCVIEHTWALSPYVHCKHYGLTGPLLQELVQDMRERERVEQELQVARSIQQASLPKTVPTLEGWQIAPCCQPERSVETSTSSSS